MRALRGVVRFGDRGAVSFRYLRPDARAQSAGAARALPRSAANVALSGSAPRFDRAQRRATQSREPMALSRPAQSRFSNLHTRRPLWDIVVIALSLGGLVVSATTLVPAGHRLKRHWRRLRSPDSPCAQSARS